MDCRIAFYFILITAFWACSETYDPRSEDTNNQAVIIAELEVGQVVEMSISTTFKDNEDPLFPSEVEGEATLSNLVSGQVEKGLRYVERTNRWIQPSFQFKEGHDLQFSADFSAAGLEKVEAECKVPTAGKFSQPPTAQLNETENTIDIQVKLDALEDNTYYHLNFYAFDANQDKTAELSEIEQRQESELIYLSHTGGILIDINSSENTDLNLKVRSNLSFPFSQIYYELKTVTQEYYDYHVFLTNFVETQQGPFNAPLNTYSNILGGQGIFVAFTAEREAITLN